jgi:hypothetical protein
VSEFAGASAWELFRALRDALKKRAKETASMIAIRKHGWISQPLRVAILLSCALIAVTARAATAEPQENSSPLATQWNSHFAIGDFDGDSQPDLATVQSGLDRSETRYWIRLEFSTGLRDAIGVDAPSGGLHIASRDVNGDHFLDLVVTTAWQHRPVAVLLNDGHGKFTLRDPALYPSAVLDFDLSWAPACRDVKDVFAAILTRNFSASCDPHRRVTSEQVARELLASEDSPSSKLSAIVSVFGRAPPSCSLHV